LKERNCKDNPPTLNGINRAISQTIRDIIPTALSVTSVAVNAHSCVTVCIIEGRTLATPGTNPIRIGLPYARRLCVYVT
jgi:hypothetical protein